MRDFVLRRLRRAPLLRGLHDDIERLQTEWDRARAEREIAVAEAWKARFERDTARSARDAAGSEAQAMRAERDAALSAEQATRAEKDTAFAECEAAKSAERALRAALADHEVAVEPRDTVRTAEQAALMEREGVLAESSAAIKLPQRVCPATSQSPAAAVRDRLRIATKDTHPGGRMAVIVPIHGEVAEREIVITQPFFVEYCRNICADMRIVDIADEVPTALIKANLLPIAQKYDRFAVIDPDIIVRKGCPDLFSLTSENRLGAVVERGWSDRGEIRRKQAQICDLGALLATDHYIDTGVMVMSRAHLPVLEKLLSGRVAGYLMDEQAALNSALYYDNVPLHELPRDFNWIPCSPAEFDWRWAWIFHMGDRWRSPPTQDTAWQLDQYGRSRFCAPVPLLPRHCRLPCLAEIAEQLRGDDVHVFHPAEMGYQMPSAWLALGADQTAMMWCEASAREVPVIYGPYAVLPAGHWSATLLAPDGRTPLGAGIVIDVVSHHGVKTVRPPTPLAEGGTFDFLLREDVVDAEVRMYGSGRDYAVGCIVIRAIPAGGGKA